jgi:flagellar biosynthetic protein FliQ
MHIDPSIASDLTRDALVMALLLAGPILGVGVLIGLVISLGQAVTQLQDQTISTVPKIVAMVAAALFFLPWLGVHIVEYTRVLLAGG